MTLFAPARPGTVGPARRVSAQARMELVLLLRNGESLLVTFGIPVGLLVFFSTVDVLPTGGRPAVDFLTPGVLAVAVMGSAMVALGIATGFERFYLVLKRLGATPLRRSELVAAKALAVLAVEAVQILAVVGTAAALGWRPAGGLTGAALAAGALLAGTAAFAGIGLAMAGRLRAVATLAAANGLFVLALLTGGAVVPVDLLPGPLAAVAAALPAAPLTEAVRAALAGQPAPLDAWGVLAGWAAAAPAVAAALFRWE